jgi:hypothetical protein
VIAPEVGGPQAARGAHAAALDALFRDVLRELPA